MNNNLEKDLFEVVNKLTAVELEKNVLNDLIKVKKEDIILL